MIVDLLVPPLNSPACIHFFCRVGWDWTFALMPYGPVWKEHRRIFHNQFNATIHEHRQIQEPAAAELLVLLLRSPGRFLEHLEQYVVF